MISHMKAPCTALECLYVYYQLYAVRYCFLDFHLPVLTSCAYESHKATLPQAPGLKVVDRPSSRENITRPVRKQD